jgi:hypothetical protein
MMLKEETGDNGIEAKTRKTLCLKVYPIMKQQGFRNDK